LPGSIAADSFGTKINDDELDIHFCKNYFLTTKLLFMKKFFLFDVTKIILSALLLTIITLSCKKILFRQLTGDRMNS